MASVDQLMTFQHEHILSNAWSVLVIPVTSCWSSSASSRGRLQIFCPYSDTSVSFATFALGLLVVVPILIGLLPNNSGLRFLGVQPEKAEGKPPHHRGANAADPGPGARDDITPVPLVVRVVTDTNRMLLVDVGEEGSLVVDAEVEDAVLVGDLEGRAVDSGVGGRAEGLEVDAVEGREHAKLELELVVGVNLERCPGVELVLGNGDLVRLGVELVNMYI